MINPRLGGSDTQLILLQLVKESEFSSLMANCGFVGVLRGGAARCPHVAFSGVSCW